MRRSYIRVIAALLAPLLATRAQADPVVDNLKAFVTSLEENYKPLMSQTHAELMEGYFRDRHYDRLIILHGIGRMIRNTNDRSTNTLLTAGEVRSAAEKSAAGLLSQSETVSAFRQAYFLQGRMLREHADANTLRQDAKELSRLAAADCTDDNLSTVLEKFNPYRTFGSDAFKMVIPQSVDFRLQVNVTFREDGSIASATAGPTGQPAQPINGLSDEENAFIYASGGAAAQGAVWAGVTNAAAVSGIGLAVVVVMYAIVSGIKDAERTKLIEEQHDLLERVMKLHADTMDELATAARGVLKEQCTHYQTLFGNYTKILSHYEERAEGLGQALGVAYDELAPFEEQLRQAVSSILASPRPELNIKSEVTLQVAKLLDGFFALEQGARHYWMNVLTPLLPFPWQVADLANETDALRIMSDAQYESLLSATVLGDCEFARCYPARPEPLSQEEDVKTSLFWRGARNSLFRATGR